MLDILQISTNVSPVLLLKQLQRSLKVRIKNSGFEFWRHGSDFLNDLLQPCTAKTFTILAPLGEIDIFRRE